MVSCSNCWYVNQGEGPARGMDMKTRASHILSSPLVPVPFPAMGLWPGSSYRHEITGSMMPAPPPHQLPVGQGRMAALHKRVWSRCIYKGNHFSCQLFTCLIGNYTALWNAELQEYLSENTSRDFLHFLLWLSILRTHHCHILSHGLLFLKQASVRTI